MGVLSFDFVAERPVVSRAIAFCQLAFPQLNAPESDAPELVGPSILNWEKDRVAPYLKALELREQGEPVNAASALKKIEEYEVLRHFNLPESDKIKAVEALFSAKEITEELFWKNWDEIMFAGARACFQNFPTTPMDKRRALLNKGCSFVRRIRDKESRARFQPMISSAQEVLSRAKTRSGECAVSPVSLGVWFS